MPVREILKEVYIDKAEELDSIGRGGGRVRLGGNNINNTDMVLWSWAVKQVWK